MFSRIIILVVTAISFCFVFRIKNNNEFCFKVYISYSKLEIVRVCGLEFVLKGMKREIEINMYSMSVRERVTYTDRDEKGMLRERERER